MIMKIIKAPVIQPNKMTKIISLPNPSFWLSVFSEALVSAPPDSFISMKCKTNINLVQNNVKII